MLGIVVLLVPLQAFVQWIIWLTRYATKTLQSQIDLVKVHIEAEDRQKSILEKVTQIQTSSTLANSSDKTLEEQLSSSTMLLQDESTLPTQEQSIDIPSITHPPTTEIMEISAQNDNEISLSQNNDKLVQQLEDIRYAALTYKERGKKDEYEKKLVEGISLAPDHEDFLTLLADHYFDSAQYVKASTLLKKIIHLYPNNHRQLRQLGQIYMQQQEKDAAIVLLEQARELKPDNPKYLISLIEYYYEQHNLLECVAHVETLTKLRPTNIDYLLTLAKLYEELKQPTRAHSYYMKVLELDPLQDEAKKALKRLL